MVAVVLCMLVGATRSAVFGHLRCACSRRPGSEDLQGLQYVDTHCHLDCILQNWKHGGLGWDCKSKLCKYWKSGGCYFGDECAYAHGEDQREPREPLAESDIRPHLALFNIDGRSADAQREGSVDWLVARAVVTSCCELEAVEDTRILLAEGLRPGGRKSGQAVEGVREIRQKPGLSSKPWRRLDVR